MQNALKEICSSKLKSLCYLPKQKLPVPSSFRYEDEINRRTIAENEFVTLKKVRTNPRALWDGSLQSSVTNPPNTIPTPFVFLWFLPWTVITMCVPDLLIGV